MTDKEKIMSRLQEHYNEALEYFPENRIVGIFLQGSQNYGLQTPNSDVDTKLIVVPSFKDIAMNDKPISTTHVRENDEHIDFKDIRLYMQTFRKQNLNFLEILFTEYQIINPVYKEEWDRLIAAREEIARFNQYRAVQSMKGIAMEKYHAMKHEYPSKVEIIAKYGYDGKQVSHLCRVEEYLERYINGESYQSCLFPKPEKKNYLIDLKLNKYPLNEAEIIAKISIDNVLAIAESAYQKFPNEEKVAVSNLLDDVQYNIMEIAAKIELM